ncbi:hypothetical protein Y032_0117g646 [Ancylostoma ceylanicum]|uniref:Uncharacterized protein n=1 Tax=Ancylostoma ceylanicum TaxID=53326 RepID=A0A016TB39_9BILA|nr:hypothetical protein Y032_0117g646 [Ancylostoma ceylanicum]
MKVNFQPGACTVRQTRRQPRGGASLDPRHRARHSPSGGSPRIADFPIHHDCLHSNSTPPYYCSVVR